MSKPYTIMYLNLKTEMVYPSLTKLLNISLNWLKIQLPKLSNIGWLIDVYDRWWVIFWQKVWLALQFEEVVLFTTHAVYIHFLETS